jgi:prefoldin subunit 5
MEMVAKMISLKKEIQELERTLKRLNQLGLERETNTLIEKLNLLKQRLEKMERLVKKAELINK